MSSIPLRPVIFMMREDGVEGDGEAAVEGGDNADDPWPGGGDEADDREKSWDDLAEAPLEFDPDDPVPAPCEDDDVFVASDGGEFQAARGASTPKAPSKEAQARHNLTHLPYASWCPWCIMGRRNNAPHFRSKNGSDRSLPLFVVDYAFVRDKDDDVLCKLLVGKLYPSRKVLACVVDSKGVVDPYGVARVAAFIRESGLMNFNFENWVVKSDQEHSIVAVMEQAIRKSGRNGTIVPENSAVGESASNARAERTVQSVEDLLRVHKHALEARIGQRLPSDHPTMRWLVEHVADILTKYTINDSGMSPYEELHGRRAQERRVEFGERVFFSTPRKARSKLDKRWRLGVYLGHAPNSNEQYIGLVNGNVIRTRSTTRIVQRSRWDAKVVLGILGTPGDLLPTPDDELSADDIEASEIPHDFDKGESEPAEPDGKRARREESKPDAPKPDLRDPVPPPVNEGDLRKVRITKGDLEKYGYTPGCPRCARMELGPTKSTVGHNDVCRRRLYWHFKDSGDVKWRRAHDDLQGDFARSSGERWFRELRPDNAPKDDDADEPPPAKAARRAPPTVSPPASEQAEEPVENFEDFIDESDNEEFKEPDHKRIRRSQREQPESEVADLFAPSDDEDDEGERASVVTALILWC